MANRTTARDSGAFGERLGAAGIRDTTQGVFTDSVFAPLLHEDPRYYMAGQSVQFRPSCVLCCLRGR